MTVKFETEIDNGTITIPEEYRDKLKNNVKVIVSVKEKTEEPYDIISELIKNPLKITDPTPITRDELYDRT